MQPLYQNYSGRVTYPPLPDRVYDLSYFTSEEFLNQEYILEKDLVPEGIATTYKNLFEPMGSVFINNELVPCLDDL